jgi:Tlde1 domain
MDETIRRRLIGGISSLYLRACTTWLIGNQVADSVFYMTWLADMVGVPAIIRGGSCSVNSASGDSTVINGVTRGAFRMHQIGDLRFSKGCVTVVDPSAFDRLERYLRSRKPDLPVPGTTLKAYGTQEVR